MRRWRIIGYMRPIFRPWILWLRARWDVQAGRTLIARRRLRRAIQTADRLQLPYESALARAELGRLLEAGDPRRNALIDEACATFSSLGAMTALKDTQALK